MEIDFTLRHGLSRQVNDSASATTTIGDLIANSNYKAILKFGEAVDAIVDGVVQDTNVTLGDLGPSVEISLETRSNSKA